MFLWRFERSHYLGGESLFDRGIWVVVHPVGHISILLHGVRAAQEFWAIGADFQLTHGMC